MSWVWLGAETFVLPHLCLMPGIPPSAPCCRHPFCFQRCVVTMAGLTRAWGTVRHPVSGRQRQKVFTFPCIGVPSFPHIQNGRSFHESSHGKIKPCNYLSMAPGLCGASLHPTLLHESHRLRPTINRHERGVTSWKKQNKIKQNKKKPFQVLLSNVGFPETSEP